MRLTSIVNGFVVLLAGGTFFLQGINIFPGSFMTGDPKWAIIGAIMVISGGAGCYFGIRHRSVKPSANPQN